MTGRVAALSAAAALHSGILSESIFLRQIPKVIPLMFNGNRNEQPENPTQHLALSDLKDLL